MIESSYSWLNIGELKILQFKNLLNFSNEVTHCFTTRLGGVSTGECSSLNMGFNRNDLKENVLENYKRVCHAIGIDIKDMVLSRQTHDNKIWKVSVSDKGKGIFYENDLLGYDGLMTNIRGIALVTFYADCVPVYFFDPVKKAIAVSHSGWRSTLKRIAAETVIAMKKEYGTNSKNLVCAIGPSIRQCCFEVGQDVYEEFTSVIPWSVVFCKEKENNKWHIDLQGIVKKTLIDEGILEENIADVQKCTKCNNDLFFSHRGDLGKTGSMTAIMQLR